MRITFWMKATFIFPNLPIPVSWKCEIKYDEDTGRFYDLETDKILISPQLLSFNDNEIIMKDFVGMYRNDANSPIREDVYRYQKYVFEENPDWEDLLRTHTPAGYNPEDYEMK